MCSRLAESEDSEGDLRTDSLGQRKAPPSIPHKIERNYFDFPEANRAST